MKFDDEIRNETLQYNINRETSKTSALSSGKIDKYVDLTGKGILATDKSITIEQANFTYSSLGEALEKQRETTKG